MFSSPLEWNQYKGFLITSTTSDVSLGFSETFPIDQNFIVENNLC